MNDASGTSSDMIGIGVLRAAAERNIRVPSELSETGAMSAHVAALLVANPRSRPADLETPT